MRLEVGERGDGVAFGVDLDHDEGMKRVPDLNGPAALWLVRHAESKGNLADAQAAQAGAARLELDVRDPDVELSETGRAQAEALGQLFRNAPADERPTAVLSSPYVRAATTARVAIDASGLDTPVLLDERLRERDLGIFDGMTGKGIRAQFADEAARRDQLGKFYYRPPSGESWADVALRIRSLVATLETRHGGRRVVVFSHQAVILVFRYVLEGLSEAQLLDIDRRETVANCSVTRYAPDTEGALELVTYNDVRHLERADEEVTEEPDAATVAS